MSNSLFARTARTVAEPFVVPYTLLVLLGSGTLVLWLIGWGFNLWGWGGVNTFATILTSALILIIGMQPLFVAYSGQIGLIFAAVNLTDPRKAVPNAVRTHLKLVLWMMFVNIMVGLMLGNIPFGVPFGSTALVFPNLLLLVCGAILFGYLFEMDGTNIKKKFVAGFLILVLGILAWNWIGPLHQEKVGTKLTEYASDAKAALPAVGAGEKARATTSCGKDATWEAPKEERSYPTVRPGCTQRFITSYRGELHLHAMDKRLDGEPKKYFVINRPSWEVIEITPKKSIPTGLDPVTITLVTTEESIDIKNKILADDEALKKAAGL